MALPTQGGFRFRLILPSVQGCWFTFSSTDTLAKIQSAIKASDPMITSVSSKHAEDASLGTLMHTEHGFKFSINDKEVTLIRIKEYTEKTDTTPLAQLMAAVAAQKPNSIEELDIVVLAALRSLREDTIAKIEHLNGHIAEVQEQIDILEAAKSSIDTRINHKITVYGISAFSFITVQWSFFFYTIYMVDWLGWDLMEPMTYTVGQIGFLYGVWFFRRTKVPNTFLGLSTRYRQRNMKKMTSKNNLDLNLLVKLIEKREELTSQKRKLFSRIVKGGPLPD